MIEIKHDPIDKIYDIYDRFDNAGVTRWPVLAASMSYYTVLAIVPFLAICFAIAKSFGLEDALSSFFSKNFANQPEILNLLKGFAQNLIEEFSGSILAFGSLGLIFWSVYRLLYQLENVFGLIYGYKPPRRAIHRVTDYLTIVLTIPFITTAAGAANLYFATLSKEKTPKFIFLDPGPFITMILYILPYLIWWLVFIWTYSYFGRGIIRWKETIIGGFFAGVIFQLFQTFYLKIFFALTSYNAIYAGFAALPSFMIWIYCSWLIVIFGGEITRRFADYFLIKRSITSIPLRLNWLELKNVAKEIISETIKNYNATPVGHPTSITQLSKATQKSITITGLATTKLLCCGLLARVSGTGNEDGPVFLPGRPANQLDDKTIEKALDSLPINMNVD